MKGRGGGTERRWVGFRGEEAVPVVASSQGSHAELKERSMHRYWLGEEDGRVGEGR